MLSIELLGHCKVTYRSHVLSLANAPRLQSLLGYLLLHRQMPIRRAQLSSLWWPDATDARAAGNLRRLLHRLRQWLPAADLFLHIAPHHLQWNEQNPFILDVDSFSEHLQWEGLDGLEAAVRLYHGELLPDCQDEWLSAPRAQLQQAYHQAQMQRLDAWEALGQRDKAIAIAQEILSYEPYLDEIHHTLIRLHEQSGDPHAARLAYQHYCRTLHEDLQVASVPSLAEILAGKSASDPSCEVVDPTLPNNKPPLSLRLCQLAPQTRGLLWLVSIARQDVSLELLYRAAQALPPLDGSPPDTSDVKVALQSLLRDVQVIASPRAALFAWLCEGLNHQFLSEDRPGAFGFVEESTRQWLLYRMSGAEQSILHLAVAQAWEQIAAQGKEVDQSLLAWHWERSGEWEKAAAWYHKAAQAAVQGQRLQEAYTLYQSHLRLHSTTTLATIQARLALGRDVLLVLGRYDEAHEQLAQCITSAASSDAPHEHARASFAMGSLLHRKGDLQGADLLQREAMAMFRAAELRTDEVHGLCEMAAMASEQSNHTHALSLYQEAATLATQHELHELRGRALDGQATIAFVTGEYTQAEALYEQALQVYSQISSLANEIRTLNNLCVLYMEQGQLAQAENFGRRSLHLRRQRGDRAGQGTALNNLAAIEWHQGKHHEALALYREALAIWQSLDYPRGKGHTLNNIGGIESELGEHQQALQSLSQALLCASESNDRRLVAYNHLFTATCYRLAGLYTEASSSLDTAEGCFASIKATTERVRCLCERGFLALAHHKDAAPLLLEAQRLYPSTLPATSLLGRILAQLQRAIQARGDGIRLLHGQHPDDLPLLR